MNPLGFMLLAVLCLAAYAQGAALPTPVSAETASTGPVSIDSATATVVVNIETNLSADLPRVLSEVRELEKMVEANGESEVASAESNVGRVAEEEEDFMGNI
ncbi:hypothetical protein FBU59_004201 [Linderina macrospora]|uniref:Uncharacterized protein n=1 Tax=Linderina macrospora TaxID=4868 RepID=A0ACC1J654_9FUNG|nr:hypothetical protein FBU59_004201 [Linderina macrospora]